MLSEGSTVRQKRNKDFSHIIKKFAMEVENIKKTNKKSSCVGASSDQQDFLFYILYTSIARE